MDYLLNDAEKIGYPYKKNKSKSVFHAVNWNTIWINFKSFKRIFEITVISVWETSFEVTESTSSEGKDW